MQRSHCRPSPEDRLSMPPLQLSGNWWSQKHLTAKLLHGAIQNGAIQQQHRDPTVPVHIPVISLLPSI